MINKEAIIQRAKDKETKVLVVTCPYDDGTVQAACYAQKENFVDLIFVGEELKIKEAIERNSEESTTIRYEYVTDDEQAAVKSMELLRDGEASMLMKGLIDTSLLLKTLLKKEYGLRQDGLLSHVGLLFKDDAKTYLISDAAMNIAPDLEKKKQIIENCLHVAHRLGLDVPVVANLCAKEKPYDKMIHTLDAEELRKHFLDRKDCIVSGPLQMDNAVSLEACEIKNVQDPACGKADIFACPTIEVGNAVAKGLKYLGGYNFAGILIGAKIPIVLVSRADEFEEKMLSLAIAACIS